MVLEACSFDVRVNSLVDVKVSPASHPSSVGGLGGRLTPRLRVSGRLGGGVVELLGEGAGEKRPGEDIFVRTSTVVIACLANLERSMSVPPWGCPALFRVSGPPRLFPSFRISTMEILSGLPAPSPSPSHFQVSMVIDSVPGPNREPTAEGGVGVAPTLGSDGAEGDDGDASDEDKEPSAPGAETGDSEEGSDGAVTDTGDSDDAAGDITGDKASDGEAEVAGDDALLERTPLKTVKCEWEVRYSTDVRSLVRLPAEVVLGGLGAFKGVAGLETHLLWPLATESEALGEENGDDSVATATAAIASERRQALIREIGTRGPELDCASVQPLGQALCRELLGALSPFGVVLDTYLARATQALGPLLALDPAAAVASFGLSPRWSPTELLDEVADVRSAEAALFDVVPHSAWLGLVEVSLVELRAGLMRRLEDTCNGLLALLADRVARDMRDMTPRFRSMLRALATIPGTAEELGELSAACDACPEALAALEAELAVITHLSHNNSPST